VGFSYGGLIASLLDAGMDTARTYCSVPDVFSDKDMRRKFDSITSRKAGVKPNWEEFDRLNQGVNFSFNSFLYGEKESPMYEQSARSLASRFQTDETEIHSVQEVGHDINSQGYATAIANLHNWLN
ncbi:MAG: hypothetical protein WCK90_05270, partial [archaeon]